MLNSEEEQNTTHVHVYYKNSWTGFYKGSIEQKLINEIEIVKNEILRVNEVVDSVNIKDCSQEYVDQLKSMSREKKEVDMSFFKKSYPKFTL